jgi:hypothetical protein
VNRSYYRYPGAERENNIQARTKFLHETWFIVVIVVAAKVFARKNFLKRLVFYLAASPQNDYAPNLRGLANLEGFVHNFFRHLWFFK